MYILYNTLFTRPSKQIVVNMPQIWISIYSLRFIGEVYIQYEI